MAEQEVKAGGGVTIEGRQDESEEDYQMTIYGILRRLGDNLAGRRPLTLEILHERLKSAKSRLQSKSTIPEQTRRIEWALRELFPYRDRKGEGLPDKEWAEMENMSSELKLFDVSNPRGDKIEQAVRRLSPEEVEKLERRILDLYVYVSGKFPTEPVWGKS